MEAIVKKILVIMIAIVPSMLLFGITKVEAKAEVGNSVSESKVVSDKWLEKKLEQINKNYDKAVKKVSESGFSDKNKQILLEQAEENRNLAIECAKKRNILRDRHRKERESLILQMKLQKENRKAVQDVMNIY